MCVCVCWGGGDYIPLVGDVQAYGIVGYRYKEGGEARSVQQRRYANPFCIIQYLEWSKWRPGLFPARYVYGQHGPVFFGIPI